MTKPARTAEALADAMIANLDKSYELVYVHYNDELSAEQIGFLVSGDTESLDESLIEWESESRWQSLNQIVDDLSAEVLKAWEDEDGVDYSDLADDFWGTVEADQVRYAIEDRDTSDYIRKLARQSGTVLLRIAVDALDEDNAFSFQEVAPAEVLDRVGFAHTPANLKAVEYALDNSSPEFSVLMGYWIVGADVEALYDLPMDGEVEITDPHLYLGNPFAGSGMVTEEPLSGTVRLPRAALRTDKGAFGYSITEIYGGVYVKEFAADVTAV